MKKSTVLPLMLFVLVACSKKEDGYMDINPELELSIPSNFPEIKYDLSRNPPTKLGFELGKKLFYDVRLSSTGFISCGFCHEQAEAFTHHGHQFSHGIDDLEGTRNTPSIQNMAFLDKFAWDGATDQLDLFPIIPITDPVEMGETIPSVMAKIKADGEYQKEFAQAFENGEVNNGNFLKALAQFMVMMISSNSKYDKYVRGEGGGELTKTEMQGLEIFREKCASCHQTDLFTDGSFRNNGLPPIPRLNDIGRAEVTGSKSDEYKFKVPSLRNVGLTAPYMHDGRFGTLEAVLDFYDSGVKDSPTLDPLLKKGEVLGIRLSDMEKSALIAFLGTLTDNGFIHDKRFAEY